MAGTREMPLAARRYLEDLERSLKQRAGVSPEEALSDAREYLLSTAESLVQSGQSLNDDALLAHFKSTFGEPDEVAQQYADAQPANSLVRPTLFPPPTRAPGWRICCTKCGRSAPLSAVGGIRI